MRKRKEIEKDFGLNRSSYNEIFKLILEVLLDIRTMTYANTYIGSSEEI